MCIHHRVPICCVVGLHVQFCFLCGWIHEWGSLCVHVACWSVCVCVRTYTVYMHISVTLRVCYICQNFSMCVYIHSVYARIWESLFMSELTPNFSEDVRTGLSQHMDKHYNWASFLSFLLAMLSAFLPWERLFGIREQTVRICHYERNWRSGDYREGRLQLSFVSFPKGRLL